MMNPAWVTAFVALATVIFAVLAWTSRSIWHLFSRISDFLEDWTGRPEDRGHKRTQGVLERLSALEENGKENTRRIDLQDVMLHTIKNEVTLNGGKSIKDTVDRLLVKSEELAKKLDQA